MEILYPGHELIFNFFFVRNHILLNETQKTVSECLHVRVVDLFCIFTFSILLTFLEQETKLENLKVDQTKIQGRLC